MMLTKEHQSLGMPWEADYGYKQAIKVGDTIYVSGQFSHDDDGNLVGTALPVDAGKAVDPGNMEIQMRQSYANAKKLLNLFGATMESVVEEVVYVTDMDAAFAVAGSVRKEAYGGAANVTSTILETPRLAFPLQLVEIKFVARV